MPEVCIRAARATDIPLLLQIDHSCESEYVWQMDVQREAGEVRVAFREIRFPRPVTVVYPRSPAMLKEEWNRRGNMLVAEVGEQVVGYLRFYERPVAQSAWVTDVVVAPLWRRQGVATALLLAAEEWARQRANRHMVLEIPARCHPAIALARKVGFEFSGYHDNHFINQDLVLFFGKSLR